jgi:uncharacterized membrane protein
MKTRNLLFPFCFVAALLIPHLTYGQSDTKPDQDSFARARVTAVTDLGISPVAATSVSERRQSITATILDGPDKGRTPTFENDFTQLSVGDEFYIRHVINNAEGDDMWSVSDPYRLPVLITIGAVFVILLLLIGGIQGIRGLVSLVGSLILIFYLLLPSIYSGYSPILVSIGVSSLIIIVGSYVTHGFNRTTTAAMLGMIATVVITGAATYWAIHAANLSGFTGEANVYLNFDTGGRISMIGLLFGRIMIGFLGILYDIAIGQAIAVEELFVAGLHYTPPQVFKRAMRIGREHIGALVNTLAIAYVGSALPLLLLFKKTSVGDIGYVINGEIFSTEIIRILMGSIGLVLAVPITTLLAAYMLRKVREATSTGHSHSHPH